MGLKADILKDLDEALSSELLDVVSNVSFIKSTNVYNTVTMVNVPTEVITVISCIVLYNTEKGIMDGVTTREYVGFIVSDTDRNGYTFETDQIASIGTQKVKVVTVKPDPTGATWKITARKIG